MRTVLTLALAGLAGACAGDGDEGPFQPGGGGGGSGGGNTGGDARPIDAPVGDGGALLAGEICVVTDLRFADACPAVAERQGVPVVVLGTAATPVTSNANG